MNFTNINDPAGVSALLEKLRSSQAWADLQQAQRTPESEPPKAASVQLASESVTKNGESRPSVASLLSQLSSSSASVQRASSSAVPSVASINPATMTSSRSTKDIRNCTFQEALPRLAQLSDDPTFIDAISKLRQDQNTLEKQLWEERQAIHAKQAEKVKTVVTKANMLGTGISEREATVMKQAFEEELTKFDRERVTIAWDGLIVRQQAALEKLGVPAMFVTDEGSDRERQQRIVQVLEGIVGSGESDGTT